MRMQYFRGNVFVANLPPDFAEERLAETFDPYGIVLSATIARDPETGVRLRHGFVDIATERAANKAIEALNGRDLDGYKLTVRVSDRPTASKKPAGAMARHAPSRAATPMRAMAPLRGTAPRADRDSDAGEAVYSVPRKQPTFQVERRPLPRRF
ncbi:MAG: RNA-binding protein [Alphaproteobacteria bacterium]|nr:RNA-binding protein [Alphaproteobacteria bacterium]